MHNTAVGRIDRLGTFYKDNSLDVGFELEVTYHPDSNTIYLNNANNLCNADYYDSDDCDISDSEDLDEGNDSMLKCNSKNLEGCYYTPEVRPLGISNPNSWINLPESRMLPASTICTDMAAAAGRGYIG